MRFRLDSLFRDKSVTGTTVVNNYFSSSNEKKKDNPLEGIGVLAASISAALAAIAVIVTLRLNYLNIRNHARIEHNNFFIECDKLLIQDPELWWAFDDVAQAHGIKKDTRPLAVKKREAYLYIELNAFDTIFYFYNKTLRKRNDIDESSYQAWLSYYSYAYNNSEDFRRIIDRSLKEKFYFKEFKEHLEKLKTDYNE